MYDAKMLKCLLGDMAPCREPYSSEAINAAMYAFYFIYTNTIRCVYIKATRDTFYSFIFYMDRLAHISFFFRRDGWNAKIDIWLHRLLNTCAAEKVHGVYTLQYIYIVHKFLGKNSYFAVRMKWSPLHFSAVILLPSSA